MQYTIDVFLSPGSHLPYATHESPGTACCICVSRVELRKKDFSFEKKTNKVPVSRVKGKFLYFLSAFNNAIVDRPTKY